MAFIQNRFRKVSADHAVSVVSSHQKVFVQGGASTPLTLLNALSRRSDELRSVDIIHLSTLGESSIYDPAYSNSFYFNALFVSNSTRKAVNEGRGDYIPIFLSEIPKLFREKYLPLDVAFIHVSPPDKHGFCSLGLNVDVTLSALKAAKVVVAQVNPLMPRTHGDGLIRVDEIDMMVDVCDTLPELNYTHKQDDICMAIGQHCAALIPDGATLQMGIGAIPDAVLQCLGNHRHLGVHTEMFSDGILQLIQSGVIDNSQKKKHRRKVATAFALGSRDLYDFVDDNPMFSFLEADYVNDAYVICKNPSVIALNSAIEIDLTGQVCADSIGTFQYSGVGGQMDFMKGASLSPGGKPIIALSSLTKSGSSKIVPFLKEGAGVVTTRAHIHYVVTEFGSVNLYGLNLHQRAEALIQISHPTHRASLTIEAEKRFREQSR
jgi:acyl-CoA hydrolase